ncbi:MAG TPA: hypothetical protein VIU37_02305 [Candidatus Limnocylindrales bacterium]|jgi:hypothetical protein
MDDRSTIAWMIMGGPRYDEHSQAELDHLRALNEQHLEYQRRESTGRLTRLVSFLDRWTARPAAALTSTACTTDSCAA